MEIHIGEIIKQRAKKINKSIPLLAAEIHTGTRNMYQILDRDDMMLSQLWKLSESLNYNLFSEFHPVAVGSNDEHHINIAPVDKKVKAKDFTLKLELKYNLTDAENLGAFIKQVHLLGEKFGFVLT